jgi:hypothetical protein
MADVNVELAEWPQDAAMSQCDADRERLPLPLASERLYEGRGDRESGLTPCHNPVTI